MGWSIARSIRTATMPELEALAVRTPASAESRDANEWYWYLRFGHPLERTISQSTLISQTDHRARDLDAGQIARLLPGDLAVLAHSPSVRARVVAAGHDDTPADALEALTSDRETEVRTAAGHNPATPPEALVRMRDAGNAHDADDERMRYLWVEIESLPIPEGVADDVVWSGTDEQRLAFARRSGAPVESLAELARQSDLPVEVAEALAAHRSRDVQLALASNSSESIPLEILTKLASSHAAPVRVAVARNRRLPEDARAALVADREVQHEVIVTGYLDGATVLRLEADRATHRSVLERLASHEIGWSVRRDGTSQYADLLRALAESTNRDTRAAVARNPGSPIDLLERLIEDSDQSVRNAVIDGLGSDSANRHFSDGYERREIWWYHRELTEDEVAALLRSPVPRLRAVGAGRIGHETSHRELIHGLAADPAPEVRAALAGHPYLTFDDFVTLAEDEDDGVVREAARGLSGWLSRALEPIGERPNDDWLEETGFVPSGMPMSGGRPDRSRVRFVRAGAGSMWMRTQLERLADSRNAPIRLALARYAGPHPDWTTFGPHLPDDTLLALMSDPDDAVREAALTNSGPTAARVLARDDVPEGALVAAARSRDSGIRLIVAGNAATPGPVLANLARDADGAVRASVAANPSSPTGALAALTSDPDDRVILGLLSNPNTDPQFLQSQVARASSAPEFERRLAGNPSSPAEVLRAIAYSRWADVRVAIAGHPGCPADTLEILAFDEDARVRDAVAARG